VCRAFLVVVRRQVLLRHGASSEELSQLTGGGGGGGGSGGAPKRKGKVKRKNTIPILHQAAAAGHTRVRHVLYLFIYLSLFFIHIF
jgi:hypothetical protein